MRVNFRDDRGDSFPVLGYLLAAFAVVYVGAIILDMIGRAVVWVWDSTVGALIALFF